MRNIERQNSTKMSLFVCLLLAQYSVVEFRFSDPVNEIED